MQGHLFNPISPVLQTGVYWHFERKYLLCSARKSSAFLAMHAIVWTTDSPEGPTACAVDPNASEPMSQYRMPPL
jgi:hypothetical protein